MKYSFLVNPVAGSGLARDKWTRLQEFLNEQSFSYEVYFSKKAHDIQQQIINKVPNDERQVIVVGGDGTLHEALNGLMSTGINTPIGYISAGSGNDFARAHGLVDDVILAFKKIHQAVVANKATTIDIGQYVDNQTNKVQYFINNVGIGIDATTVNYANESQTKKWLNKLHLGGFSYLLAVFKSLARQDAFNITMTCDDGTKLTSPIGYLVTISNHPYFGGGIKILPDAQPDDGLLDAILVDKPRNLLRLIWLLGSLLRGHHYRYPEVHHVKTKTLSLCTKVLEYNHLDGEVSVAQTYDLLLSSQTYTFYL